MQKTIAAAFALLLAIPGCLMPPAGDGTRRAATVGRIPPLGEWINGTHGVDLLVDTEPRGASNTTWRIEARFREGASVSVSLPDIESSVDLSVSSPSREFTINRPFPDERVVAQALGERFVWSIPYPSMWK